MTKSDKTAMPAAGRLGGARNMILASALSFCAVACGGPQMKLLTEQPLRPLDRNAKIEIFIGEIKPPYQEVAIIESDAYSFVDNEKKKLQVDQLREKARGLGANAVQNVHILTKRVKGYTIDERVPFTAWQQGEYELYLMRGTAIRVPESEPTTVEEARPLDGWAIDKLAPPPRLDSQAVTLPPLRSDAGTTPTAAAPSAPAAALALPPPPAPAR